MRIKTNLLTIYLLTITNGCFYTSIPEFPDIKPSAQQECKNPVIEPLPPIPKNLMLEIIDGKAVKIDAGGELLIRRYIATRKAINEL